MLSVLCYRKFLFVAYCIRSLYAKFMFIALKCDIAFMELQVFFVCQLYGLNPLSEVYFLAFSVRMMLKRCPSVRIVFIRNHQRNVDDGAWRCAPEVVRRNPRNFKKRKYCGYDDIKTFYVIYPSAELSHCNWQMTSTLGPLKVKQNTWTVLE